MIGLLTVVLLGQSAPPLVAAEPEPEPMPEAAVAPEVPTVVEAPPAAPDAKSTARLHFSAGGGALNYSGGSGAGASPGGPGAWVAIGKPLYMGDRRPRYQWILDASFHVAFAPQVKLVQLVLTPTVGTNWFFGVFGLEWRGGLGFGATPGVLTGVGLGGVIEGSLVFMPFDDDRKRIKVTARELMTINFLGGLSSSAPSLGLAVGYEMPL